MHHKKKSLKNIRPFYAILFVLVIVGISLFSRNFENDSPLRSVEVGVATLSEKNPEGGYAVPASCPSFAHTPGECDPSVTLTVNNAKTYTATPGEELTFRWTNNLNTFNCTAVSSSGDIWTGDKSPAKSGELSEVHNAPTASGSYNYDLTCRGPLLSEAVDLLNRLTNPPAPQDQEAFDAYYHSSTWYRPGTPDMYPTLDEQMYAGEAGQFINRIYSLPRTVLGADVAIGSDNIPRVAYYDHTFSTINLYTCSDANCSGNGTTVKLSLVEDFWPYSQSIYSGPLMELTLQTGDIPVVSLYIPTSLNTVNVQITCSDKDCANKTVVKQELSSSNYTARRRILGNVMADLGVAPRPQIGVYPYPTNNILALGLPGTPANNYSYAVRNNGEWVVLLPEILGNGDGQFTFGLGGGTDYYIHGDIPWGPPNDTIVNFRLYNCRTGCTGKDLLPPLVWETKEVTDSVTVNVINNTPPAPPTATATCPSPGNSATLSWTPGAGAPPTFYSLRINDQQNPWVTGCTPGPNVGDSCINNYTSGTTYAFTGAQQGHTYDFWVFAGNGGGSSVASPTITFTCPAPDLHSIVEDPGTVQLGTPIRFQGRVRNDLPGGAPTLVDSVATFRIDMNNDGDWTDAGDVANAGTFTIGIGVNVGTGIQNSSATWTPVLGTHQLFVCADTGNVVTEVDESNNCTSRTFTVNGTVDYISGLQTPPSPIYVGDAVRFTGLVSNRGTAAGTINSGSLYEIDTSNNGSWDRTLGTITVLPLAANSATTTLAQSNTWTAVAGQHRVRVCADAGGVIAESDNNNNCFIRTFIVLERPDMLSGIDPVPTVNAGTVLRFQGAAGNRSNQPVSQTTNSRYRLYINNGSTFIGLGTVSVQPLAANSSTTPATFARSNTWISVAGTHRIEVCADTSGGSPNGAVIESDENNNCASRTFTVLPAVTPLAVTCTPIPSSTTSGTPMTWRATPTGGSGTYTSFAWDLDGSCDPSSTATKNCTYSPTTTTTYIQHVSVEDSNGNVYPPVDSPRIACTTGVTVTGGGTPLGVTLTGVSPTDPDPSDSLIEVVDGGSVNLTWTTTGSPTLCTAFTVPSNITSWNGTKNANGGTQNGVGASDGGLTLANSLGGQYTFLIQCTRGSTNRTASVPVRVVGAAPGFVCGNGTQEGTEACDEGTQNGQPGSYCSVSCTTRSCNYDSMCQLGETPLNCRDCRIDEEEK